MLDVKRKHAGLGEPYQPSNVGRTIKFYREKRGFSKAGLARLLDVTDAAVGYWERGEISQIGHLKLCRISQALGISLDMLMAKEIAELPPLEETPEGVKDSKGRDQVIAKLRDRYENDDPLYLTERELKLLVEETGLYGWFGAAGD